MSDGNRTYRPRSPDLSSTFVPPPSLGRLPSYSRTPSESVPPFSPRASIDTAAGYPPVSAVNTAVPSYFSHHQQVQSPASFARTPTFQGHSGYQANFAPYNFNAQPRQLPNFQQPNYTHPDVYGADDMARTRAQRQAEQVDPTYNPEPMQHQHYPPQPQSLVSAAPPPPPVAVLQHQAAPIPKPDPEPTVDPALSVEIRTKFPVARIKRIMQADEDIGKVAQATPTAAAKALELFMTSLVIKSATTARAANSKRITVNHLKAAIAEDKNFDFLNDLCAEAPDEEKGGAKKAGRGKSEEVSDEEGGAAPKRKAKKRKGSEESD